MEFGSAMSGTPPVEPGASTRDANLGAALFNEAMWALLALDDERCVIEANRAACALLGVGART